MLAHITIHAYAGNYAQLLLMYVCIANKRKSYTSLEIKVIQEKDQITKEKVQAGLARLFQL